MMRSNEAGITLIEVLTVIALGFIIAFTLYSILNSGMSSYKSEIEKNKKLYDAAYALKVLTKEIRKTTDVNINEHSCALTVGSSEFRLDGNTLLQNEVILAHDIQSFKVTTGHFNENEDCSNGSSDIISLKLTTDNNQVYSLELALRRGG